MPLKRRALPAALVLIVLAAAIWAIQWYRASDPVPHGPNILLISIDTLRADHLGCYGYSRATTPSIDALAQRGLVFSNCTSESSWTLPSHVTMLTGLPQEVHGVRHVVHHVAEPIPLVAERLSAAGYRTGAVVCAPLLDPGFGFGRGFESYDNLLPWPRDPSGAPMMKKFSLSTQLSFVQGNHAELTTDRAIRWLEGVPTDQRFFMFVHYWDVHYDYMAPAPYTTQFDPDYKGKTEFSNVFYNKAINAEMLPRDLQHLIARYDGEIAYTDAHVGRLIDWLQARGVLDNTLVILTADHGEEFFEHGDKGHGETLYRETTHVPLIVVPPASARGARRAEHVTTLDLAPTLLTAAGLPHDLPGRDLLGKALEARPSVCELKDRQRAIRVGRWRAHERVKSGRWELYDAEADPGETTDLSPTHPDVLADLQRQLARARQAWGALREERFPGLDPFNPLITDRDAAMRQIGYR